MDSDEPMTPGEDVLGWINDNWPGKIRRPGVVKQQPWQISRGR